MIDITPSAAPQHHPLLPLVAPRRRCRSLDDLRRPLTVTAVTPNLISMPAANALSLRSIGRNHLRSPFRPLENGRSRSSKPHRSRRRHRRPSDSRFRSLETFERRPRPGAATFVGKGPASETLHKLGRKPPSPASDAIPQIADICCRAAGHDFVNGRRYLRERTPIGSGLL